MFIVCAILALASIWGFRYPAGIDLPQHANVLRILAGYHDPHSGYAAFYDLQYLTPYVVAYLIALPFAKIFGALAAVKVVLSITAIATPRTMINWLRAVDGEPWWGLFGYPLAFGFAYHWGLFSFVLGMPIMFSYLLADRRLTERPGARSVLNASGWALVLCFCHGVTFAVAAIVTGLEALIDAVRTRDLRRFGMHVLPSLAGASTLVAWQLKPQVPGLGQIDEWPPRPDRFVALLSGEFSAWVGYFPAVVGALIFIVILLAHRPIVAWSPRRLAPLGIALGVFLFIPEMIGGTWLVGTRMVMFVHAFGAAAFNPGVRGRALRRAHAVTACIVIACLVGQGVRLFVFNREMRGVAILSSSIPRGVDVQTLVVETSPDSESFGRLQIGQAAAWVTAANGGFLSNDSGGYLQFPIRRPPGKPWISEYRWFVARGPDGIPARAQSIVGRRLKVAKHADDWWLLESMTPPRSIGGLTVVRHYQGWGQLAVGRSLTGGPLRVAGQEMSQGLATHALSKIQVRTSGPGGHLRGRVAIDDSSTRPTELVFRVEGTDGKLLFDSGPVVNRQPPVPFEVALQGRTDLILSVDLSARTNDNQNAHADWLDLHVGD